MKTSVNKRCEQQEQKEKAEPEHLIDRRLCRRRVDERKERAAAAALASLAGARLAR